MVIKMGKKQSLGKGFDLIFEDNTVENSNNIAYISIENISPKKNQPRKSFDAEALSELASSIAEHGVIQPIIVRDMKNGGYEIIAGERRWRASKQAGLSEIPCIIVEADEIQAAQLALIENIQREDLNSYEEAKAFKSLIDDFGMSQDEVAKKVGKSRPAVTNSLRLLELPDEIIDMLQKNLLTAGHCRALLGLRNRQQSIPLAVRTIKRNLSVREVESAVKKLNKESVSDGTVQPRDLGVTVNYYDDLERRATDMTGRKIIISRGKSRKVIQIEYTNNEDLEELLTKVCGKEIIEQ